MVVVMVLMLVHRMLRQTLEEVEVVEQALVLVSIILEELVVQESL